jgi:hypothetical protein
VIEKYLWAILGAPPGAPPTEFKMKKMGRLIIFGWRTHYNLTYHPTMKNRKSIDEQKQSISLMMKN